MLSHIPMTGVNFTVVVFFVSVSTERASHAPQRSGCETQSAAYCARSAAWHYHCWYLRLMNIHIRCCSVIDGVASRDARAVQSHVALHLRSTVPWLLPETLGGLSGHRSTECVGRLMTDILTLPRVQAHPSNVGWLECETAREQASAISLVGVKRCRCQR